MFTFTKTAIDTTGVILLNEYKNRYLDINYYYYCFKGNRFRI